MISRWMFGQQGKAGNLFTQEWLRGNDVAPGGMQSDSGELVSMESALRLSAVFAAVRLISETIASIPLVLYERTRDGKRKATEHPIYPLLHDSPDPRLSSFTFRETLQAHVLLGGNAYARIERTRGQVSGMFPLAPERIEPKDTGSQVVYEYRNPKTERTETLRSSDVLHVPGLGFDGIKGYSVLTAAREALGAGLAIQRFGAELFANGIRQSGVITHPGTLTDEAFKHLAESTRQHTGKGNRHKMMILEEGASFAPMSVTPEDAQFLETRKLSVGDIARYFRVPPHLIGDLEKATFSNIEQQSIEFVMFTMRPWLVRWEQEFLRKLFPRNGGRRYFAEFNVEGLLRGDTASRYAAYASALAGRPWMTRNEVRKLENMNKTEGGDEFLDPLNMGSSAA